MSKLSEYKTLEEKAEFFLNGNNRINTKEEFDKQMEKLVKYDSLGTYIFRGCGEAKHKLYTSSQRYWIEKELQKLGLFYHGFIKKLIKHCKEWNNNTIFTFFNQNGINTNNSLAYLSYMQHNGVPTPLLDFTDSPHIGLYFALEKQFSSSFDNEIENYCSLYLVDTSSTYFHTTINQFEKEVGKKDVNEIDYDTHLSNFPIILVTTKNESYKIINSINISNQQGLFFYNNNPIEPIEKVYKEAVDKIKNQVGKKEFENLAYQDKFGICLNIHKNLREYVLWKLEQNRITSDFIYPDNMRLRQSSLSKTLEEV